MNRKPTGRTVAIERRPLERLGHATFAVALALAAFSPFARAQEDQPIPVPELTAARTAAKDLGEKLRSELVAALKAGGPSTALGVCRTVAPSIAEDTSQSHELTVGRTALKVRNPENAPDAFERRVLEEFTGKIAAGTDPATLEYAQIVTENGERTFRYMKAISTAAEPCLACHGSNIEPGLKAEILDLYPDDEATGFAPGDLRGAFTVIRKMK